MERRDTDLVCFKAQIPIYEYPQEDGSSIYCCDLLDCPIWGKKCAIYEDLVKGNRQLVKQGKKKECEVCSK